jgi:hypothetical protein
MPASHVRLALVRRTLGVLLSGAVLATIGLVAAPAAQAAMPRCHTATNMAPRGGYYISAPAAPWNGVGNDWYCNMMNGTTGAGVVALQQSINDCYIDRQLITGEPRLLLDGKFGAATQRLLTKVQRIEGVDPDGVYGPKTRDAMKWDLLDYSSWCLDGWY